MGYLTTGRHRHQAMVEVVVGSCFVGKIVGKLDEANNVWVIVDIYGLAHVGMWADCFWFAQASKQWSVVQW